MTCIPIKNGILCVSKTDFKCPDCGKEYDDHDEKFLNKCNKNKSGYTAKLCECGSRFGITYDMKGNMVGFAL